MRRPIRTLLAVPALAAALALSACAQAERPAVPELATGVKSILAENGLELTDEQATCMAERLEAAEISDATLAKIAQGKDEQANQEEADLVASVTSEAVLECMGGNQ